MPTIGLIYLLYFLRMIGLFCILPVFAIAARGGRGARRNSVANWISSRGLWHRSVSDANPVGLGL